ncbi:MAG: type II secretion system protein [Limisphaerales bacterium]
MKTRSLSKPAGFALLSLLCAIVIILIVFAGVMYWIASNSKQMQKNEVFTTSEAAAEGMTELVYANMDRDFVYGNLNSSNYYQNLTLNTNNWPVGYNFNVSITMGPLETNLQYLGSEYTNLLGEPQTNTITVTATPVGKPEPYDVPASVSQTYVFASIPAFQFAIFYNINLEIDPGAPMPINGAVFCNGGIWSGTPNVTYSSTVQAVDKVSTNEDDPYVGSNEKQDTGTPQANFQYAGSPPQPESGCNPLNLPIGANSNGTNDVSTNVQAVIEIPPASVRAPNNPIVDYEQTNLVYDFNAASMVVSNWCWGSNGVAPWSNNFTVYLQDSTASPSAVQSNGIAMNWIMLTNDFYVVSNSYKGVRKIWGSADWVPNFVFTNNSLAMKWTNLPVAGGTNGPGPDGTNSVWYAGFSFLTNATYYDYREADTVRAVQIDVGKLGAWITNATPNAGSNWNQELCADLGHGINSMYLYNAVPLTTRQLPAVRVTDGTLLPSSKCHGISTYGFSFATGQPMYVLGNYNVQVNGTSQLLNSHNTADTYPAAFLADAITILSPNWSDSYNSSTSIGSRTPTSTTINAACLEGIVPSVSTNYSGGVENFLRLLEDWNNGIILTYNGSIMVMFPSQVATNLWPGTGSAYNAAKRDWGFDTNFLIQADLPPLTPQFRSVVRNTWAGY